MTNAFIQLYCIDKNYFVLNGKRDSACENREAPYRKYLFPVDQLVISEEKLEQGNTTQRTIIHDNEVIKRSMYIKQDFETIKSMLTNAGIKIIEQPTKPDETRTLKVGDDLGNGS